MNNEYQCFVHVVGRFSVLLFYLCSYLYSLYSDMTDCLLYVSSNSKQTKNNERL